MYAPSLLRNLTGGATPAKPVIRGQVVKPPLYVRHGRTRGGHDVSEATQPAEAGRLQLGISSIGEIESILTAVIVTPSGSDASISLKYAFQSISVAMRLLAAP